MAYAKRGFQTKAWPVFEKAYGMGCRDMDFLWAYANECMETGETYRRQNKKIGRNDPCPCGSGKKFKQCCINKGIYD